MVYIFIALFVFLLDNKTKNYIEHHYKPGDKKDILKGKITIRKHYNSGFLLNVLDDRIDVVRKISGTILGFVFLVFVIILPQKGKRLLKLGLALSLGGATSNVKDRFKRGYVVDYFTINIKPIENIVFNLSDIFIFIGSFIIFLFSMFISATSDNRKDVDKIK